MCRRTRICITILLISAFVNKSHERALVEGDTTLLTQKEIPPTTTGTENEIGTKLTDNESKNTDLNKGIGDKNEAQNDKINFENITKEPSNDQNTLGREEISAELETSKTTRSEESKLIDTLERENDENSEISKGKQEGSLNIYEEAYNDIVQPKTGNRNVQDQKRNPEDDILVNSKETAQVRPKEVTKNNKIQFPEDNESLEEPEIVPRIFENTEAPVTETKFVERTDFEASSLQSKEEYTNLSTEPTVFQKEATDFDKLISSSINHSAVKDLNNELPRFFEKTDTDSSVIIDLPIYEKEADAVFHDGELVESATLSNSQEHKAHRTDLLNFEEENIAGETMNLNDSQTKDAPSNNIDKAKLDFNNSQANIIPSEELKSSNSLSNAENLSSTPKLPTQQETPIKLKQDQTPGAWYSNIVALFPTYVLNPLNYFGNATTPWNYTSFLNYSSSSLTNLLRSQFVTNATPTSTAQLNSVRNTISNSTQLHLIPYFKIFKIVPHNASGHATEQIISSNIPKAPEQQLATGSKDDLEALSIRLQTQNIRQIWPYYQYQSSRPIMTYIEMQPSQSYNYPSYSMQAANQNPAPPGNVVPLQPDSFANQVPFTDMNPFIKIDIPQAGQKFNRTTKPVGNTAKKTSSTSLMVEMVMPTPILKFMKNIYNLFVPTN